MADILFLNNASSLLDLSINNSILTIQLASGDGAKFPVLSLGQSYFVVCLEDDSGNIEYCKIESRSTDVLTVESGGRGFDNSVAQAFIQNVTRVELRLSAAVVQEFLQKNGDIMSGDLDMNGNEIQDAELTGATIITGGQTVGTAIRGTLGQTNNELSVPAGSGVRATAGGADIVVDSDDIVALLDTAGVIDLASATIRVIIGLGTGADLRIASNAGTEFLDTQCDGTDILAAATGITDLKYTGIHLHLADSQLKQALIADFAILRQAVSASATTNIDYELGQYVELDMDQTITNLNITNPPASGRYGTITIKLTQSGAGSFLVTNWPSGILWPGGAAPTLSTATGKIDFVSLWTDDAGTTWYGDFTNDYL